MSWNKQQIKHLRNTAVRSLFPDGQYNVSAEGVVEFLDGNSATEEEIVAEEKRILKEYEDSKYQRDRADAYPDLKEQFDLLWHAIDDGKFNVKSKETDFYKKLKAVKDANPKPE